MKYEVTL